MVSSTEGRRIVVVLIVDDEPRVAMMLAEWVRDMGHEPLIAADGGHAMQLARECWPALVLTELMMPVRGGIEFVAAMRSEALGANRDPVPTIVISTLGAARASLASADAYLAKPFDLTNLESLCKRLLPKLW
jgi:two-component system, chemotaxis family, chemotaxis protein CheY